MSRSISAIAFLIVLACGCSASPGEAALTVAAASSLAPVFDELGPRFQDQTGWPVTFSYGSTGSLAEQLRNGAPFDLLASADALHVDRLIEQGLLLADTRTLFALGELVLVSAPGSPLPTRSLEALADPAIRFVAIANPRLAPYGLAAAQAFDRGGVLPLVEPKLVFGENVLQAAQMVASGNAEAGLISATTALSLGLPAWQIPPTLYDPIQHIAAVSSKSPRQDPSVAFLSFLLSPEAAAVFARQGLTAPGG